MQIGGIQNAAVASNPTKIGVTEEDVNASKLASEMPNDATKVGEWVKEGGGSPMSAMAVTNRVIKE